MVQGKVFKYGDNVDTDVIIPARYLNVSEAAHLAAHCMEDIDKDFVKNVKAGDIIVAHKNFGCGSSREQSFRRFLCDRKFFCQDFLPEQHQYWIADHRVLQGCGRDSGGRRCAGGFCDGHDYRRDNGKDVSGTAVSGIDSEYHRRGRLDEDGSRTCEGIRRIGHGV